MTQLELAIGAESTARHVSFLETGRSRPSAEMVGRLCNALDIPEQGRQSLLKAAGLPSRVAHEVERAASEVLRFAAESMALSHSPQPAFVFDDSWNVLFANDTGNGLLGDERNLIRALFAGQWRYMISNWETVAWPVRRRLQQTAVNGGDASIDELVELAELSLVGTVEPDSTSGQSVAPIFVFGEIEVPTVSVVAQFGSLPTTGNLQVELIYATTDTGRALFHQEFGELHAATIE